jgi:hypothetical protein
VKKLLLAVLACAPLYALPACTQITDQIPTIGVAAPGWMTGTIDLSLGYSQGDGAYLFPALSARLTVANGVVDTCQPAGTYSVLYSTRRPPPLTGVTTAPRVWTVPVTGGPYTVASIESGTPSTPAISPLPLALLSPNLGANPPLVFSSGVYSCPTCFSLTEVRNEGLWTEYTGAVSPVASGSLSISSGVATFVSGTPLTDSMLREVMLISGVGYYITTLTDVGGVISLQFTPTPADGTVSYVIGLAWTLAHTPSAIGATCWYNGNHQSPGGIDYTLNGNVISSVYWNPTDLTASPACDYQY